ncbi:MAG: DNA recombination protein RmuC [Chlamydiota bacterium]
MAGFALLGWGVALLLLAGLGYQRWRLTRLRVEKEQQAVECARLSERAKQREELELELKQLRIDFDSLKKREGELEGRLAEERKKIEEKIALVNRAKEELAHTFRSLSSEVLAKSNDSFLQLAQETLAKFQGRATGDLDKRKQAIEELIRPMRSSLNELDRGMRRWEKERKGDQEALKAKLQAMIEAERDLRNEAQVLAKALRAPIMRGRWGELQLRRVVELADMLDHCDFCEQKKVDRGQLRPDLVVHLPGGKQVVIDAKTPSEAYLEAVQMTTEKEREEKLRIHARHVRQHVLALGKKAYWRQFPETPEFVVLFIPSDNFFSAALQFDPSLIEIGVKQGVVIATPTTLIGLLRAIAYGWKQETISRHADEVRQLGCELYQRLTAMGKHWSQMGRSLGAAVEAYNRAVGSLESRVFVSARKFQTLGASIGSLPLDELEVIDRIPRILKTADMKNEN